ncbi:biotin synthase BioB [Vineibacter terrae]|uniref:biotin synthase BioB n=1 Tax=Vineibacter terrae TaxID=2586908 RepID=UPI002F400C08
MTDLRHDWTRAEVEALHALPFPELLFQAQSLHRRFFDPTRVETASLLSIKTGGCPEDCGYCSQTAHFKTGVEPTPLMDQAAVVDTARQAKAAGATRFCMGAAWRNPKSRHLDRICAMVTAVKGLGMQTCATLGMLTPAQARQLHDAGLDFYSHNVDTSPEYYGEIITTRTLQDRLDTLDHVRAAGIKVCCGGIVGMGERVEDRIGMLLLLARMQPHPESVPLNIWNEVAGTPVQARAERPDPIGFARLVALARILMPGSIVRLAAGRQYMSDELQALCLLAGANSIFIGNVLLTTRNPQRDRDATLLQRLGMTAMALGA